MRLSTNDPDDYHQQTPAEQQRNEQNQAGVGQYTQLQGAGGGGNAGSYSSTANNKTLGNQRKVMVGSNGEQKVATISQNYTEKSMLLSSDEECQ